MLYSAGSANRIVPPVSSYTHSPFSQTAYRQPTGSWLKPSYNPYEQIAKTAATGIANFLKSAQSVQSSANSLLQKSTSSLQARETVSSDNKSISASAESGASFHTYQVTVSSIAESQKNSGASLNTGSLTGIQSGTNQIKLTIGGKSTTISSHIAASDTNEQALTKIKTAINDAKTGVTASVVNDSHTGTSKLELKSDKTGTDQAFAIADVTGNAATTAGITTATTAAANASYSLDGGASQSSQTNRIELEKGKVTATLLQPTAGAVDIEVRPDEKGTVEQVKKLISSYNTMHDRLKEAGGYLNPSVKRSLEAVVSSISYEQIGIEKNGDGTLKLDETKLKQRLSANYEQTKRSISGSNGMAKALEKATDRFNDTSASALLNQKMQAMQQFAAYQSSMQSYIQLPTTGLLVNSFL
ncbi:flagellar filament capping protein FliD [Cohnella silvisoli]|uniref:Flagellar hook-associated protein 2 n=1 Tax=Cohnella silvisoli TaxID=2873699 RepID=A0ABV1L052_9BACL|nr:flagellar filament capping protein FliD [Cohnella silvisoli]MCD9024978.1 flagellar filament capping protein FliD [Cohnella silvisoli]